LGALAGLRVDATPDAAISPYAVSGLAGNFVWANVSNRDAKHALQGERLGFVLGGGAAIWLGALPAAVTVDVRHVFSPQIARTSYSLGLRVQPRYRLFKKRLESDVDLLKNAVQELLRLRRLAIPDIEGVVDATSGMEIALGDELFVKGTAVLSNRAGNELAAIAALLQRHPTSEIAIDLRPHLLRVCADMRIVRERALALRAKLIEAGISGERITELMDPKMDDVAPAGASEPGTGCRTATLTILGTHLASGSAAP
jgi:outer membrane protein OmpA-like peptidoglycan-associated protein